MVKIVAPPKTFKVLVPGHGECEFKPIKNGFSLLVTPVDGVFPIAFNLGENLIISTTNLGAVFNTGVINEENIERLWDEHNKSMSADIKGGGQVN